MKVKVKDKDKVKVKAKDQVKVRFKGKVNARVQWSQGKSRARSDKQGLHNKL